MTDRETPAVAVEALAARKITLTALPDLRLGDVFRVIRVTTDEETNVAVLERMDDVDGEAARLRAKLEWARLSLMQDVEPDAVIVGIEEALR